MHLATQSNTPKHFIFKKSLNGKESASSSHTAQGEFHSSSALINSSVLSIKMTQNPNIHTHFINHT